MDGERRFAFIDALRGYAALGVIAVHTMYLIPHLEWPVRAWADSGKYGVQLFFVVSAFTLLNSWHRKQDGIVNFFVRRFFRIAPMFWLSIPVYLIIDGFGPRPFLPDGISWPHIVSTLLFVHGWHPSTFSSVVPGGWSIAAETTFYLVFPILAAAVNSLRRSVIALCCAIVMEIFLHFMVPTLRHLMPNIPSDLMADFVFFSFFNQLAVFMVGFVVYFLFRQCPLNQTARTPLLFCSIAILGVLPLLHIEILQHMQFAMVFGLFTFAMASGAGEFLVNRVMCRLGKVSFSAYLSHFAIVYLLGWIIGLSGLALSDHPPVYYVVALSIALVSTFAISSLTYRWIELPMIFMGSNIVKIRSFQNAGDASVECLLRQRLRRG